MGGYTLVLGSYLPGTGESFDEKTKARLDRALRNGRCKKTTLVVVGKASRETQVVNPCSRAKYLRRRGVSIKCLPSKTLSLEFEVRRYLKFARAVGLEELTIIGGAYEELRVRLVAEYYFGEEVARRIRFIAAPGDWGGMHEWLYLEPLAYAKYLPKVWQQRMRQTFGTPPTP